MLGAFFALFVAHGLGFQLGGWIFIHGVTELFAIILGGAAGFRIGWRVAFPGDRTRIDAAAEAGRAAAPVMAGVVLMLVVAGLLEGFARQLIQDDWARYAIAAFQPGHLDRLLLPAAPGVLAHGPISRDWENRMTASGSTKAPGASQMREFVTPEGVDLRLRVGSAGERAAAFLLDAVIIIVTLVVFVIAVGFAGAGLASLGVPELRNGLGSAVFIVWLLGFFFLRNFYFITFELGGRAATPGKRILGLRVAARDGGRLTRRPCSPATPCARSRSSCR